MPARLARYWRDWLSGGGYLMLLVVGFEANSAPVWSGLLALLFGLAVPAWLASLTRWRAVADTPTSRIASAAQGYVELVGNGQPDPEQPVFSPTHHLPCLWYRYRHFVRHDNDWRQTESGESDGFFALDDGSGRCLINPDGAEVHASRKETYIQGDHKTEEELLLAGDRVYALGQFISHRAGQDEPERRRALGDLLAHWKEDRAGLHARFDLDRNGAIDDREWQLARLAAQRELDARHQAALDQAPTHVLGRPRHGRPFLVASFPPEQLAGRYRLRAWLHGLVAGASLIALAATLQFLL